MPQHFRPESSSNLRNSEADETVVLVGQYRYVVRDFYWEMPTGAIDPGESEEAAVQRELAEEAGYAAERLTKLCTFFTSKSVMDERAALYLADGLRPAAHRPDPTEFIEVRTFPFTTEQIQAAHSQWTADWLAWERTHDYDYKLKAAAAEHELAASVGSPIMRARLEAVEREKLDLYQRRYQDYVRVSHLLALIQSKARVALRGAEPAGHG